MFVWLIKLIVYPLLIIMYFVSSFYSFQTIRNKASESPITILDIVIKYTSKGTVQFHFLIRVAQHFER